jgi:hypothetical protein
VEVDHLSAPRAVARKTLTAVDSANNYGNFIAYKITLIDTLLQATNELLHPISLNPGQVGIGGGKSSSSAHGITSPYIRSIASSQP